MNEDESIEHIAKQLQDAADEGPFAGPLRFGADVFTDAARYLRELSALRHAKAEGRPQWQPIETAPRSEGRRKVIDVWCVTDDHESAKFYFGASMSGVKDQMLWQGRVTDVYWRDGAWRPVCGLQLHALTVTPTHWRALPDPPEVSGSDRPDSERP
jgi:hypothetical protein